MTDFQRYRERTRDIQDYNERMVWGSLEHIDGAGSIVRARGTDTEDEEMPVANFGYGFNVPQNYNTEVIAMSLGSDTNQKYALTTIPRDKQRKWEEGKGGVQHPTNPDMCLEFADDGAWLKSGTIFLGANKEVTITIDGGVLNIAFSGRVNIQSNDLTHNGTKVGDDHVHSQGNDSDGDGEVDTDGPH